MYGFASGDPVNFSDPFGLCSIEKWTECKIFSANAGFRLGLGVKTNVGGARVNISTPSLGLSGEVSVGAQEPAGSGGLSVEGYGLTAEMGDFKVGVEGAGCASVTDCTSDSPVSGSGGVNTPAGRVSTSGDISVETTLGVVRVGATFHAKQAATAVAGATVWAVKRVSEYLKKGVVGQPK